MIVTSTRSTSAKIIKRLLKPHFEIYLKETGVLVVSSDQEYEYGAEEVKVVLDAITSVVENEKYLILIDVGPLSNITFDALNVLAKPEAMNYAHAKAYVIYTLPQRLMANFYQQVFKPRIPIRFFSTSREAEAWLLRSFRNLRH